MRSAAVAGLEVGWIGDDLRVNARLRRTTLESREPQGGNVREPAAPVRGTVSSASDAG